MAGKRTVATDVEDEDFPLEQLEEIVKRTTRHQSESERRTIRQESYAAIGALLENRQELTNPESDVLNQILEEQNQRFMRVLNPREAALDSHILALIADAGRQKAQAFTLEFVKFQPSEFSEKLKTFVDENLGVHDGRSLTKQGWKELGSFAQRFLKKSPPLHFMCGSFERGEVVKKTVTRERRGKKDTEPGKTTELKELKSFSEKREATTEEVEEILKNLWNLYENLNEKSPICYFEFVVNPHSFGQTVENIFYVSFLARDGFIKIFLDEDGLPVIEPLDRENESRHDREPAENAARQQMVVAITPKEWKEIIKTFKITQPLIKSRAPVAEQNGAASSSS
ncbi:hypothetical protein C0Q70_10435 [Pomacea canaliculata]|uniref:Non-structural maintenance of chromosomes element 4 n=1 Tax=Pomacea canaliculata TaxID=400727 RepID=A0A2T7PCL8_POMCA|nr:non-structural maintenance of chromosomes element 4 homolog A-like [Pomacea canaliculata]PVD31157.1 hypothetical protein C0Q70_10435 [Pomacea canaliculata]